MANSSIYEKIENKGALDAAKIREDGSNLATLQMQEAIDKANREIENLKEKQLKINNEKIKTKSTQIEQLAKQRTLFEKKKLIDETFERALKKLQELKDDELTNLVVKLLLQDFLDGDETIIVSKDDYKKYAKLFSSKSNGTELDILNKKLGNNFKLKLSNEPANINGGFIVIGRTYDINHSFTAILNEIKEKTEADVAVALFSKGK